jgi:rubrerythrin
MFTDAMTQTQVTSTVLSDCQYNIVKQLEKKTQFLWSVDGYIKDAEKEGNTKCAQVFRQIKEDEEKHAKMLKELLSSTVQS